VITTHNEEPAVSAWQHELLDLFHRLGAVGHRGARVGSASLPVRRVAARSGYTPGYVSEVYQGKKRPSVEAAVAIAAALGASAEDIGLAKLYAERLASTATSHRDYPRVPHLLPPPRTSFAGRLAELRQLTGMVDAAMKEPGECGIVITGAGGVGKTWLALRWAHANSTRFPDGQLYADLRGFHPSATPAGPEEPLRTFLVALGRRSSAMPAELTDKIALYRRLTEHRQLLIVLDNVHDADQIEPLCTGHPGCCVIMTSRSELARPVIHSGMRRLRLSMLDPVRAQELLAQQIGADRVAAEPEAVARLVQLCAGLPLALRIVAARALLYPDWSLGSLAAELADRSTRLDALETDDPQLNLREIFSGSYRLLEPDVARTLRLCSLAPAGDIGGPVAASLTGLAVRTALSALRRLASASLAESLSPDRFRLHDLLRLYGIEQARIDPDEEHEALQRLTDHYLHSAYAGERIIVPQRPAIPIRPASAGTIVTTPADPDSAMAWFDEQHATLLQMQRVAETIGRLDAVWQLAWSLDNYHYRRGMSQQQCEVWQRGLSVAESAADPGAVLLATMCLGNVSVRMGRHEQGLRYLSEALRTARERHDLTAEAQTHRVLGLAWEAQQDHRRALRAHAAALRLFSTMDAPIWRAMQLNAIGETYAYLGNLERARRYCLGALRLHQDLANRSGEAAALDSLGTIARQGKSFGDARTYYQRALDMYRALRHASSEADTLMRLGEALICGGDPAAASMILQQALSLFQEQRRYDQVDRVLRLLPALPGDGTS
jgi:tetratricopeptide (TPR) repeat protein/transcriptional regulator with XRE-family HTH domain